MKLPFLFAIDFGSLLTVVVFILAGLGQLLSNREPAKPKPARRPPQPPAGDGPKPPGGAEDQVRREVEEFLRRAQNKEPQLERAKPPRPPQRKTAPQRKAPPQPERDSPPRRRPPEPARTPSRTESPVRLEAIEPTAEERESLRRGESVAKHVAEHIDSQQKIISERVSHLGEDIGQADERLEKHLRTRFEHKLGSLDRQAESPKLHAAPTIAEEVIQMMARPDSMRTLILASEILKRPDERW